MSWNSWFDQIHRDVRYAVRSLWKSPGFTLPAIITFALGIGATTAVFSTAYAVLLKPLPYFKPDEIYSVEALIPERGGATMPLRVQDYLEWRKANTVFSDVAALTSDEWNLTGDSEPERVGGARISTNFFSFLGVDLERGRGFAADEEQPGKDNVVIISDSLWRSRYAADPSMVGKKITMDGQPYEVVGIAPSSLLFPTGAVLHPLLGFASRIAIWKPIAPTKDDLENESWDHAVLVRLKPGQNEEQGRLQLQTLLNASLQAAAPEAKIELKTKLIPMREIYAGKSRLRILVVLGTSVLLLLAACSNIVNLLMVRVTTRSTEIATRMALGAGRARVLSYLVIESIVLAVVGGALGVCVAVAGLRILSVYSPEDMKLLAWTHLDLPVWLFATAVAVLAGLASVVFPARQALRKNVSEALHEGNRAGFGGSRAAKLHQVLVGIELALGTVLLASAALLLHSFVKIMNADRGYQIDRVMTADLNLSGPRYSADEQRTLFYAQLFQNLQAIPGTGAVGAISKLPALGESGFTRTIFYPTDTDFQGTVLHRPVAAIRSVTPGFFSAAAVSLLAGRPVSEQEPSPVALISRSLAKQLWPTESIANIVGHGIFQGDVRGPVVTVIGVVEDVRSGSDDRELPPQVYRPYQQLADPRMTVVVRTSMDSASAAAALRSAVRRLDPDLPILSLQPMREILLTSISQRIFQMLLTSVFGLVALILVSVGVYGVVGYSVASRTRDIGMRLALGAMPPDVLRWLFATTFRSVLIGVAMGLAGAIACASIFRALLFGIAPADPLSLAGVAAVLLLTSALACYIPARRAARVDPLAALREG